MEYESSNAFLQIVLEFALSNQLRSSRPNLVVRVKRVNEPYLVAAERLWLD